MKSFLHQSVLLALILFHLAGNAQVGSVQIIDNSPQSSGVSKMVSADLNQDGFDDIIASFTGSNGKLGYYLNNGGTGFSTISVIDNISFLTGVSTGDFNNDGWPDIVDIGGIDFEAYLYLSNNGNFSSNPTIVDTNIDDILVNDIETADFDNNGSDDFVIIGQSSINYYRNNGNATFIKEEILTTSTSPEPLECLDLAKADFNGDGHLDLVAAETAGLVVYTNSGNGVFSPHYYSTIPEVGLLVHPFDMDNDGDMDVVMTNSFEGAKWFRNDGSGAMTFEAILSISPELHSFLSADVDNNGAEDLYASYFNNISYFLNDTNHTFASEISIFQDNSLYMDELLLMDVDNDGLKDYVWSGTSNTVSYHLNTNNLQITENSFASRVNLYPNPSKGVISIETSFEGNFELRIFDLKGRLLLNKQKVTSNQPVNLNFLPSGIYLAKISYEDSKHVVKLLVE